MPLVAGLPTPWPGQGWPADVEEPLRALAWCVGGSRPVPRLPRRVGPESAPVGGPRDAARKAVHDGRREEELTVRLPVLDPLLATDAPLRNGHDQQPIPDRSLPNVEWNVGQPCPDMLGVGQVGPVTVAKPATNDLESCVGSLQECIRAGPLAPERCRFGSQGSVGPIATRTSLESTLVVRAHWRAGGASSNCRTRRRPSGGGCSWRRCCSPTMSR
jgi:hypothetical protein